MRHFSLRVADALVLLWLVITLTFVLMHLAPGDPATLLSSPTASPAEAAAMRARFGLDAPVPVQYARWMYGVLRGDLGESLARGVPVTTVIGEALPVSLFLGGVSLLLSFAGGILVGLWQALRADRRADNLLSILELTVYSAPSFWLALALVVVFTSGAVWFEMPQWLRLPAFGMADPAAVDVSWADRWRHAILPLVVLGVPGAAGVARFARRSFIDTAAAPFVASAAARGLRRWQIEWRYVVRNAFTPLVVLFGLMLPGVMAGSVFVEQVFAWPGLGRTMIQSIAARDYPVVLGISLIYATTVILSNLAADILLWKLDPRRRGQ